MESWSKGIVRPVMEIFPYAWLYFVPFILIATFTMLNLFIAIIVNSMNAIEQANKEETTGLIQQDIQATQTLEAELQDLRAEVRQLTELLQRRETGK